MFIHYTNLYLCLNIFFFFNFIEDSIGDNALSSFENFGF